MARTRCKSVRRTRERGNEPDVVPSSFRPHAILFDLDGTLTNPYVGISRCIAHAMASIGRPLEAERDLRRFIGPPLRSTFLELCGDERLAAEALERYRERFEATGMYENIPYDGVAPMLRALGGRQLYVCTSKPTVYAKKIAEFFGLSGLFVGIYGSEMDGARADKDTLIAWIVEKEHLEPGACLMVGDRRHDIVGARKNGIRAHGVLWGYGTKEELIEAGADELHETPVDLAGCLARP
jgi:phosphoglycolate phosphatase